MEKLADKEVHCTETKCPDFTLCELLVSLARPDMCTSRFLEEGCGSFMQYYLIGRADRHVTDRKVNRGCNLPEE